MIPPDGHRLLEVNPSGTVPVAKDLDTNEWVVDSGVIAEYLENKFPEHPLGTTTDTYAGYTLRTHSTLQHTARSCCSPHHPLPT